LPTVAKNNKPERDKKIRGFSSYGEKDLWTSKA